MTLAPAAASLDTLTLPTAGPSPCPQPDCTRPARHLGSHRFPRRLSRVGETRQVNIAAAIPEGSERPRRVAQYLDAVLDALEADHTKRADGRATIYAVAKHLAWSSDENKTARPTWVRLMERTGRSWSTIGAALLWLRAHGLLGIVATGRRGTWEDKRTGRSQARDENEAAVYVLAVPAGVESVDEDRIPRTSRSAVSDPPGAREAVTGHQEPLRGTPFRALQRVDGRAAPAAGGKMTRRAAQAVRWAAAYRLQLRLPALQSASTRSIGAVIRPWLAAGWSVLDLHHAVDWRADGRRHPHDGATGVVDPARWLMYRLASWLGDDGTPAPSRSQLSQAAAERRAAERRAGRDADARRIESAPTSTATGAALARAALAQSRAGRHRA